MNIVAEPESILRFKAIPKIGSIELHIGVKDEIQNQEKEKKGVN